MRIKIFIYPYTNVSEGYSSSRKRWELTIFYSDNDSRLATTLFDNRQFSAHAYDARFRHMTDCRTGLSKCYDNSCAQILSWYAHFASISLSKFPPSLSMNVALGEKAANCETLNTSYDI